MEWEDRTELTLAQECASLGVIESIKFVRSRFPGMRLVDAKAIVEAWQVKGEWQPGCSYCGGTGRKPR